MDGVRLKRIGFDLDNTIIDYRALFLSLARREGWVPSDCVAEKEAVKQGLQQVAGDAHVAEQRWRQLQAWAYASCLQKAYVFEGFEACVTMLRKFHVELVIVSHKTEVSNFDPSARLRHAARQFLEARGFFRSLEQGGLGFEPDQLFFESTRAEKVARLRRLEVDVFVDDLAAVFAEPGFPASTQPLWFRPPGPDGLPPTDTVAGLPCFATWGDLHSWFEAVLSAKPPLARTASWQPLSVGGNNRIFKVGLSDGTFWALKTYPRSLAASVERAQRERLFSQLLVAQGVDVVATPRAWGETWLLSSWIEGVPISEESEQQWTQLTAFLTRLAELRPRFEQDALLPAAHARFRLHDFLAQIQDRFDAIQAVCTTDPLLNEYKSFVDDTLATDLLQLSKAFHVFCQKSKLDPHASLPPQRWFPSPSDFGFHNALSVDGDLMFVDFEYAGWDDLAKLLADLVHHLGFQTPYADRLRLVRQFAATRLEDPTLWTRFEAVHDLAAFEWILIVLNVALPRERRRKLRAGAGPNDEIELISQRFAKAKLLQSQFRRLQESSVSI